MAVAVVRRGFYTEKVLWDKLLDLYCINRPVLILPSSKHSFFKKWLTKLIPCNWRKASLSLIHNINHTAVYLSDHLLVNPHPQFPARLGLSSLRHHFSCSSWWDFFFNISALMTFADVCLTAGPLGRVTYVAVVKLGSFFDEVYL